MDNNLIKMQEIILRQMERLDKLDNQDDINSQSEISRANALAQNASTFLKSVNVGLRIIETSKKYETQKDDLFKELGVYNEK